MPPFMMTRQIAFSPDSKIFHKIHVAMVEIINVLSAVNYQKVYFCYPACPAFFNPSPPGTRWRWRKHPEKFSVTFKDCNTGSTPFYYRWPVELSLLDPNTRRIIWSDTFKDVDIRRWLPGVRWNEAKQTYDQKPRTYTERGSFRIPDTVKEGEYILAIAILDPAGMLPSARFAIRNYFKGGRHPIGRVGIGNIAANPELNPKIFDDPAEDNSLYYIIQE